MIRLRHGVIRSPRMLGKKNNVFPDVGKEIFRRIQIRVDSVGRGGQDLSRKCPVLIFAVFLGIIGIASDAVFPVPAAIAFEGLELLSIMLLQIMEEVRKSRVDELRKRIQFVPVVSKRSSRRKKVRVLHLRS